jgi:DNA topoisomerase I
MEIAAPVLTHKDIIKIDKDYEAAASVAHLRYVCDKDPGIERVKKGKGFAYRFKGKSYTNPEGLARIKKLAIPPAWTKVWICPHEEGHIQATGYDVRGRKQYRYHARWSALQQETKFHRMIEFGKALPNLRKQIQKDLAIPTMTEPKVMATLLSVMEKTFIRVGNEGYEKLYGSYGLTTLKNNHVSIKGDEVTFSFKGKKGVYHKVQMRSKRFAKIIRQCRSIPGKELFQYYNENNELQRIDSGQVNQYLKDCLGMDFTTKDFRTWAGTLSMLAELKAAPLCSKKTDYQKNITAALNAVSKKLGNTVAVCKKYYVHPEIVKLYKDQKLTELLDDEKSTAAEKMSELSAEEQVLMKLLRIVEKSKVELCLE